MQFEPSNYAASSWQPRIQDFRLLHAVGQGGMGVVWYAKKSDSGEEFAVKIVDKSSVFGRGKDLARLIREREILVQLQHPLVISLQFAFQDDSRIFFVMDYCTGGDFYTFLKRQPFCKLGIEPARFFLVELILALEYVHSQNIIHGDLKPENCKSC
jgi:serine/threonine protein kinase